MSMNQKSFQTHHKSSETTQDFFSVMIKWVVLIFLLGSISFVFFSAFVNQSRFLRCSLCKQDTITIYHHHNNVEVKEETNMSHVLFGIAGSVKTWKDRRHYSELWWEPNTTRGFVWLDEEPNEPWQRYPFYRVSEDTGRFKYTNAYGSRSAIRISRIVKESYNLGLENVRWFVMGDDDTVFFPRNLVTVLAKYDHDQMYYIGGNSESIEQDELHSYGMAFGGGGFAVSVGLARELVKLLDGCIDRYSHVYGSDERIASCLDEIGVPLTKELGFHQVDIRGNPYGLLAAHPVTPLVSLHHLQAVDPMFPSKTQLDSLRTLMDSYKVDPGRTLQQSFCHDFERNWSVSVSWGYTAQVYPWLMTAKDLETPLLTFKTWRSWRNEPFTFNTRTVSPDPCENPVVYFFNRVDRSRDGQIRTLYKKYVNELGKECGRTDYIPALEMQYVNVKAWKMERNAWKKAPRRQCCEIENRRDGVVDVRIRRCNPWESVTPEPSNLK